MALALCRRAAACFLLWAASGASALDARGASASSGAFAAFIQEYGRTYKSGTAEYDQRRVLFERRAAEVEAHNRDPLRSYTATINDLADRSEEELAELRGYRPHRTLDSSARRSGPLQLLSVAATGRSDSRLARLPSNFTWRGRLKAMDTIQNQGSCGSCWAVSTATALRAHSQLYVGDDREFSSTQILRCTPNPMQCGGRGGCSGATAALAMDYVMNHGCATPEEYHSCPHEEGAQSLLSHGHGLGGLDRTGFGMFGYDKLPRNRLAPIMLALYQQGPVVVSLSAGFGWNHYSSGIMNACDRDAVINHAVVLVGYGEQQGKKYWAVQNSWGKYWGEGGFIRLQRHDADTEEAYCGWDHSPEDGSGCRGGPSKVWVCGSCGILYDVVVPRFALKKEGLWSRFGEKVTDVSETMMSQTQNRTHRFVSPHMEP
mmetsp:Transcript_15618/g.33198  ORF Transcript_15618/g.33198 Transcript_15618/m.33198 type:complete len:431 (-) Transcript_15618:44-1336(-)